MEKTFDKLVDTIKKLRHPVDGCPWDLEQTHESLKTYLLEETHELIHAIDSKNQIDLKEELGDVLLQVILHAQLASEANHFDIDDVCESINEKMIRRHPHVFANKNSNEKMSIENLHKQWREIKEKEGKKDDSPLSHKLLNLNGFSSAVKIGKQTQKIGFDWKDPLEVFSQVRSELDELEVELKAKNADHQKIEEELGDLLFSAAQLSRHLKLNPELTLMKANKKFHRRFHSMLKLVESDHKNFHSLTDKQKEAYWKKVKENE